MIKVFIVGRVKNTPASLARTWDFQGVFSSEDAAVQACRDFTYFVGPAEIDVDLPHETIDGWPSAYFPIADDEG